MEYKFMENLIDFCFRIPTLELSVSSIVERYRGCVKFNFRADRTSQKGFTLVRLWTTAKLLSRRVASMWITRRVALRRGEERPTAR